MQGSSGLKCKARGRGLLVTARAAKAGWLSGVRLKQSVGLGGRGEVKVPFYRAFGQLKGP